MELITWYAPRYNNTFPNGKVFNKEGDVVIDVCISRSERPSMSSETHIDFYITGDYYFPGTSSGAIVSFKINFPGSIWEEEEPEYFMEYADNYLVQLRKMLAAL